MFGIGFSEIAIIVLLLIILIKPDDLPAFFRKLGRLYAQAKKAYKEVTDVKDEFLREMDIAAAIQDADKLKAEAPKADAPKADEEAPKVETEAAPKVEAEGGQDKPDILPGESSQENETKVEE
ncbi:MAG TPA: hypothetical protein VN437_08245 [Rectinemataceae bacterium]|nr:hypothetical protein [Rectinemataceae bacterium]